jgi:hypothetical protein
MTAHVLTALPSAPPGATSSEVLAVVRRDVPRATLADVVEALGLLATGRPGARRVDCATARDARGEWVSRWWRVS